MAENPIEQRYAMNPSPIHTHELRKCSGAACSGSQGLINSPAGDSVCPPHLYESTPVHPASFGLGGHLAFHPSFDVWDSVGDRTVYHLCCLIRDPTVCSVKGLLKE